MNNVTTQTLSCTGITKTYGKTEVLHGVDLTLEKGKIYGLIGRNGAGKTTLLSILTAQNPATSGSVVFDGAKVWENQEALDHICFSRELNPMTSLGQNSFKVKEYLRMAATYYPNWDNAYAERMVKEFGLDKKKRIAKLSKGMMSMVTIVVALASGADFTILDEPVAGLDVVMREHFYDLLLENYTETGRTFIVSTHIIEEAANVFEEVIIIKDGRLLMKENTEELVASFAHISGKAEDVDAATAGLECYRAEKIGRSKAICVRTKPGDSIRKYTEGYDLDVEPMNLQKVFVALCGEEKQEAQFA